MDGCILFLFFITDIFFFVCVIDIKFIIDGTNKIITMN